MVYLVPNLSPKAGKEELPEKQDQLILQQLSSTQLLNRKAFVTAELYLAAVVIVLGLFFLGWRLGAISHVQIFIIKWSQVVSMVVTASVTGR